VCALSSSGLKNFPGHIYIFYVTMLGHIWYESPCTSIHRILLYTYNTIPKVSYPIKDSRESDLQNQNKMRECDEEYCDKSYTIRVCVCVCVCVVFIPLPDFKSYSWPVCTVSVQATTLLRGWWPLRDVTISCFVHSLACVSICRIWWL
jgi:hypothetical protein